MARAKAASTVALSDFKIRNLKPGRLGQGERQDLYDVGAGVPGFFLRLSFTGTKTFILAGRVAGEAKVRQITLGRYIDPTSPAAAQDLDLTGATPFLTLSQAREKARLFVQMMKAGRDPVAENKATQEAAKGRKERAASKTFGVVAETFLKSKMPGSAGASEKWTTRTYRDYGRLLRGKYFGRWQNTPIESITRRDVKMMMTQIMAETTPAVARSSFVVLRSLMNWAAEELLIEIAPTLGVKGPRGAKARDRVLSDLELSIAFECMDAANMLGPAIKLLALTGARLREITELQFSEIHDLDGAAPYISLAGERTKNDHAHIIPLAPMACEILQGAMARRVGASPFVFSSNGHAASTGYSVAKVAIDRAIAARVAELIAQAEKRGDAAQVEKLRNAFKTSWRFHDLRRTFVTVTNSLGVAPHVVEAAVNHVSGAAKAGVAGIYNRATYLDERRACMNLWAAHVARLIDPDLPAAKVIQFRELRSSVAN